jgi:hypothetical protein
MLLKIVPAIWEHEMKASLVAFALILAWTSVASSHGGGLDSNGCHHDRKRGTYHCH